MLASGMLPRRQVANVAATAMASGVIGSYTVETNAATGIDSASLVSGFSRCRYESASCQTNCLTTPAPDERARPSAWRRQAGRTLAGRAYRPAPRGRVADSAPRVAAAPGAHA